MYLDSIAEFEDPDGDIVVFSGRQEFYTKWVILHCVAILLWPIEGATLLKNCVKYIHMVYYIHSLDSDVEYNYCELLIYGTFVQAPVYIQY